MNSYDEALEKSVVPHALVQWCIVMCAVDDIFVWKIIICQCVSARAVWHIAQYACHEESDQRCRNKARLALDVEMG